MNDSPSTFQTIVIAVFVFFIVAGVGAIAVYKGGGGTVETPISLWGTVPAGIMSNIIDNASVQATGARVTYVEKNPATYEKDFVEALAEGKGPDLIILPQDLILSHQNKLTFITFATFPEREYKDTFTSIGELVMTDSGTFGVPFTVDPLVLYWNRRAFESAGVASVPKTWEDLSDAVAKLTVKDSRGGIVKSAIPLGTFDNINHSKDIISALLMQTGNDIVARTQSGYTSVLDQDNSGGDVGAESAIKFYTDFSDPAKASYTWSRAFASDSRAFAEGNAAMYVGFASELSALQRANPNLDFDVTELPQGAKSSHRSTFGRMNVLSITNQSKNKSVAYAVARALTSADSLKTLSELNALPPIRRDLLAARPASAYMDVFYQSALMSHGWLDPSPTATNGLFRAMIEAVISGRQSPGDAVSGASNEIKQLLSSQ